MSASRQRCKKWFTRVYADPGKTQIAADYNLMEQGLIGSTGFLLDSQSGCNRLPSMPKYG